MGLNYKDIEVSISWIMVIVQRNYLQIKQDIQDIIQSEMERMLNDPGLAHLVVRKGEINRENLLQSVYIN